MSPKMGAFTYALNISQGERAMQQKSDCVVATQTEQMIVYLTVFCACHADCQRAVLKAGLRPGVP